MTATTTPGEVVERARGRLLLYAISRAHRPADDHVLHALSALHPLAQHVVVITPAGTADADRLRLADHADEVLLSPHSEFDSRVYPWALEQVRGSSPSIDEVVLTGDAWFGPMNDFTAVIERMAAGSLDAWAMVENANGQPEAFPDAGFAAREQPWTWTAIRKSVFASAQWSEYWGAHRSPSERLAQENEFIGHLRARGRRAAHAFPAADFPSADPAFYTPTLLLDAGCPTLARAVFTGYPPFLDRFAVIGREILADLEHRSYPVALIRQNLARTMPPKAFVANAGMLDVLPDLDLAYDPASPLRIAAVVHITDLGGVDEILERLSYLPDKYDLFLTTTDGKRATQLHRTVEARGGSRMRSVDVRVTPASRGRDMSDFFVGCRDVLLSGDYDLVVKVHSRRMRRKTVNVKRYFRRYQFENLLNSPGYVANLLALFQREAGLGFVFPPMMHIGYSTMGSGWGGLRDGAEQLCTQLGIHVPFDQVSPLAPFGGMWIGRPEALRLISAHRWRVGDYSSRGSHRYRDLAHVQERLIAYAGAELGYHSRLVLTREHAAISHTALESKVDNLFSTTRGWPVEQIQLMQRAGATGHGGIVALSRMYIRLNHPRLARVLMPLYELAFRSFVAMKVARTGARRLLAMLRGRPTEGIR